MIPKPYDTPIYFKYKFVYFWLQELKQEKYDVKLRLERVQDEYDMTLKDLQQEMSQVREELNEREDTTRRTDCAKSEVLKELTQQNQRLTQQIRKVSFNRTNLITL